MLGLLGIVGAAALPAVALRTFVIGNYVVPSESMSPTIHPGDRVLGEKVTLRSGVRTGDVVTLNDPQDAKRMLIKRVIALEGQEVERQDGSYRVPDGCIFVMGDNREHSTDSRSFGAVPLTSVTSRAVCVYWPPEHVRTL